MQKAARVSVRDLEEEAKKFLEPRSEKEKAVLEAALSLIGERGIDGATTAEIARRAGVTEKTLFRYFPSKADLVRRVLFPLLLRIGLMRNWAVFEDLMASKKSGFRDWYVMVAKDRFANISRNPTLARTVLQEVLQNKELREAMEVVWRRHIWHPMIAGLEELQASGAIRKGIKVETLARAIHCMQVGYFLTRYLFAPSRAWDDDGQIEKMAEILAFGSGTARARR